jgi:hypothetical protein
MAEAPWQGDLSRSGRRLSIAVVSGLLAGLVIGGLGGRVAMLILRLTSEAALRGVETDDGFTIGVISSATVFLLVVTAAMGMLAGVGYLLVRTWLPRRWRPATAGALGGIVGGALIIRPGGLDFAVLDPLPLAVAMFIAISAGCGAAISVVMERRLARDRDAAIPSVWWVTLLPTLPILLLGPIGLVVILVAAAGWLVSRTFPVVTTLWRSAPAIWIGRFVLVAVAAIGLVDLVSDVNEIL